MGSGSQAEACAGGFGADLNDQRYR